MATNKKNLGNMGEAVAANYLTKKGYRIKTRNFRTRNGEIDMIAEKDGTLVFVEVKTRRSFSYGSAGMAVTLRKQHTIARTAMIYLHQNEKEDCPCRFDVIEVYPSGEGLFDINHIENAFEA